MATAVGRRPGGKRTGGRKAGTPNKINATLKEAILMAAEGAHLDGMVGYLKLQAQENPTAFMTLLGKVLPMQVSGSGGGPVQIILKTVYEDKPEHMIDVTPGKDGA